jgi:cysteine desulfurase/selenocysteine lyase
MATSLRWYSGHAPADTGLTIQNVREQIVGIDVQVPLLDGSQRTYVNFDNAASTPALRPVAEKVNEFLGWYSSVHRGSGFKSQVSTHAYEEAHRIVCEFLGANPATNVAIFGKNSTEALNKLARRLQLQRDDVVLTTLMEHHSNDLPWRTVAHVEHVEVTADGALDLAHLESLLRRHAGRVKLVAVTGASNVTGYINPVYRIAEWAHIAGAQILVDIAQLAPHRAIDMLPDDDPSHLDYVVLSAHKMYAPFGTGALVGRAATFLQGDPDMVGGGTVDIVTVDDVKWAGLPDREEAGSPNVVGAVAMAKTMLCLQQIGMRALAEHEASLTARMLDRLASIEGVRVYGITDPARATEKVGVIPLNLDGMNHYLVAAILSEEGGIGVRNGCFCAHPYMLSLLGVSRGQAAAYQQEIRDGTRVHLPGLVRISFGCYNSEAEVDWFADMMARIARGEYRGKYVQDPGNGSCHAEGFPSRAEHYFAL